MLTTLLAQQASFNAWLDRNPLIVGLLLLGLGALMIARSVWTLFLAPENSPWASDRGRTRAIGILRLVAGVVCTGIGVYKLFAG